MLGYEVRSPFFPPLTTRSAAVAVLLYLCFDTASVTSHAGSMYSLQLLKVDGVEQ